MGTWLIFTLWLSRIGETHWQLRTASMTSEKWEQREKWDMIAKLYENKTPCLLLWRIPNRVSLTSENTKTIKISIFRRTFPTHDVLLLLFPPSKTIGSFSSNFYSSLMRLLHTIEISFFGCYQSSSIYFYVQQSSLTGKHVKLTAWTLVLNLI